jgi:hypothetical protein
MRRVFIAAVLTLAAAAPALAQNFAPAPPPRPRVSGPQATICSTDWGWCPMHTVATPGGGCYCFVPPSTWLQGSARYYPYQGPVSPYLNPHMAPPSTLR